ncbi:MAG TPA: hypothetical protein VGT07_00390 [Steroidobacteraceae bacterium]|nr:hypothetical protein [Steroidobacteraceae bacterium]
MTLLSRRALSAGAVTAGLMLGLAGLAAGQSDSTKPAVQSAADGAVPAGKAVLGGRVIAKGPGYSILAAPGAANAAASAGRTTVTDAPLETLHEPIVCRGQRVLNIDNRDMRFDGNAIAAEDGCELHITNSRISAGGIAIRARNASVHIENSEIQGGEASIDAAGGAQIYAEASTFKGAARRLGQAAIHDLGNNNWF